MRYNDHHIFFSHCKLYICMYDNKKKKSHSSLTVPEWSSTSVLDKPNDAYG